MYRIVLSLVHAQVLVHPLPEKNHKCRKMIQDEWFCELSTKLAKCKDYSKDNEARHLLPIWLSRYILLHSESVQEHVCDLNPKPRLLLIHPLDNLPNQVACLSLHLHDIVI
jgi:hypothetical protein